MERIERKESILAWHFVGDDKRLRYGSGLTVEPGYIYSEPGEPVLCQSGMHASLSAYDALQYAPGSVVCRVRLWGRAVRGDDKIAAEHREVLWMADAASELRLYACWCVRQQWDLLTDQRSRNAVEIAERFARGEASADDLAAARDAAWDAAWAAAWAAAWDAAWAAARSAAWDAAWAAARDAQRAELERRMLALGEDRQMELS